ncbi:MAG: hypothetical protein RL386_1836 [Bacteroidota bacterium]|jgi:glycopeptide antibiotics resistance protein
MTPSSVSRKYTIRQIATVAYVAAVLLLHILPAFIFRPIQPRQEWAIRLDSLVHIAIFIPWMLLDGYFFTGGRAEGRQQKLRWLVYGATACTGFEACQLLTASRAFDLFDMACNLLGLTLGALLARIGQIMR